MRIAKKMVMALLLTVIGITATACEFGAHRGSHSNTYEDDNRED